MKKFKKIMVMQFCLVLITQALSAQNEKISIGIMSFTGGGQYNQQVYNIVANAFEGKSRFVVVERSKFSVIAQERNLQKNEEFIDGEIAQQGKSVGAKYVVTGDITLANLEKNRCTGYNYTTKQNYYYDCFKFNLVFTLKIIDVETGIVFSSQNFDVENGGSWIVSSNSKTAENAVSGTLEQMRGRVLAWINKILPAKMEIIKVETFDKSGMPRMVLISGGTDMDMRKGSDLNIYEMEVINHGDRELERKILVGTLKVMQVGTEVSTCKVSSNSEVLNSKLNQLNSLVLEIKSYK